jgi:hypothetical protein
MAYVLKHSAIRRPRDSGDTFGFGAGLEDGVGASLHHGDGEESSMIYQKP